LARGRREIVILSPVRRLYQILCAMETAESVEQNLVTLEDYKSMRGDREPRFCEWAYDRIDERTLVAGLMGTLLRLTDARRMARDVGCPADRVTELGHEAAVREALSRIGVVEPGVPVRASDGVKELQGAYEQLDERISGRALGTEGSSGWSSAGDFCRRGMERLLKMLTLFLWDIGFEDVIKDVVKGGLQGFKTSGVPETETDWIRWLHGGDLGMFNVLLRSVSEVVAELHRPPPFLREGRRLWPEGVFQVVKNAADCLQELVHDTNTTNRFSEDAKRAGRLFNALGKVRKNIDGEQLWVPRTIQFFRQIYDGHGFHHEGYDDAGARLRVYESDRSLELNTPYLFMAATNPSGIDVSCAALRDEFTRPV
jgi:hypothetical protein